MNLLFIISIFKDLVTEGGKKELLVSKMLIYIYIYIFWRGFSCISFFGSTKNDQISDGVVGEPSWIELTAELSNPIQSHPVFSQTQFSLLRFFRGKNNNNYDYF